MNGTPADLAGILPDLVRHTAYVPASTTVLAERTNISLAGASQHATVLRNAGLITTRRTGTAVLHTLTPLGDALLDGTP